MRVTRGTAALSLTVVAVLGLSACSSEGEGKERPAAAAEASAPAEEVAETGSGFDLTTDDFVERVTAAAQAAGSVSMEMTTVTAGVTETMSGSVRYADGAQDAIMRGEVPDLGTLEVRMVDGTVYMAMGELTQGKFLQIDPDDPSNPLGGSVGSLEQEFDPTGTLSGLDEAIVSVEKSGEPEEVGGALAQAYTVVVESSVLPADMTESLAALGQTLPPELTYTYWVDADDLMRRVTAEVAGATNDTTFSGWGDPVEITAPPADQITDASALGF